MKRGFKVRVDDVAGKRLAYVALKVIRCRVTQDTRVQKACDDVAGKRLADAALHFIGCHSTQDTRLQNACQ